jgi:nitrite reductase (NADH) large subunit
VRKGDLLCTVDDAETAKVITGRFLQYYRENAKWLERTYAFVPRIGLDHIRAVVFEDCEGIAGRLDAEVAKHAQTYVDPWTDGADPVVPGQFRSSLPLEVLPRVPSDRTETLLGGPW